MKKIILLICFLGGAFSLTAQDSAKKDFAKYVNPFIGTANFGTTFPGPVLPRGMASVVPFNVAGKQNHFDKDSRWFSTSYEHTNHFLTGFSHVNLSGVGCPDLGVILLMPTTGEVQTNHLLYGTTYKNETATPGYYSVFLEKYKIKTELTATQRVGVSRYHFPKGKANILLNLGLGLTNEQGAMVKVISPTELEGIRSVGSFCYNSPERAYPVYFVVQFSKPAARFGVWKKPALYKGVEAQWMGYNGKTRLMKNCTHTVVGDSIGTYFSYDFKKPQSITIKVGISYVSIENARENLKKETENKTFQTLRENAYNQWNEVLSKIEVTGGSLTDKTIFYTALYHTHIHPNIFQDFNGQYREINTGKIARTQYPRDSIFSLWNVVKIQKTELTRKNRYTVFSLWDTYRNLHPLLSLAYPQQQSEMLKTMLGMYEENGWLPKWELNSTETFTMVGDPAAVVITDSYLRGITDFDVQKAYKAMLKSAYQTQNNPVRQGIKEYLQKGYLTTESTQSGAVSITQEFNIADYAIAQLAKALGKKKQAEEFYKRSVSYRKLFDKNYNLLRPKNPDGSWHSPFNPQTGANFVKNIAFIEGNSWQYTFMVSHDTKGLIQLMGGKKAFVSQLERVFKNRQFDMANEPDIGYPYLFNFVKGQEWRTQKHTSNLIKTHFKNSPDGIPGNDDTGTMSAWLVWSMIGLYPIVPAQPVYTFTRPVFDSITIHLNEKYYKKPYIKIYNKTHKEKYIKSIFVGKNKNPHKSYFISHKTLIDNQIIEFK